MSSVSIANRGASPRALARGAGFLYLITIIGGVFGGVTRSTFIVSGNASATAGKILASEPLFRLSFTADLIAAAAYLGVTALLYELLKPVSRSLSLLAALFSLTGIGVAGSILVNHFQPLHLLEGAPYATVFDQEQLQALAFAALEQHATGYLIGLFFFGLYCLLIGYLIIRSRFLPSLIGLLMMIAGLSYMIIDFSSFLSFPLPDALSIYIMLPPLIGEGALMLWLVVIGVNVAKWEEQAGAVGDSQL